MVLSIVMCVTGGGGGGGVNLIDSAFMPLDMDLMDLTHTRAVSAEQGIQYTAGFTNTSQQSQQYLSTPVSFPTHTQHQPQQQQQAYGLTAAAIAAVVDSGSGSSASGMMSNSRMLMMPHSSVAALAPLQQSQSPHSMASHQPIQLQQPTQQQLLLHQQQQLSEPLSEPKTILKPELGGGLSVTLRYRYAAAAVSFAGAHCAYLTVHNHSDHAIR